MISIKIFKIFALIVFLLLIYALFNSGSIVYINDKNQVVQIDNRVLDEPRPLTRSDTSSIIKNIDELKH